MNARVFFPARRVAAMLAGALVLLLISALFTGPAWAITGGEPDNGRHPNVGAVIFQNRATGGIGNASGTLVHPRVFLTAGHVVGMLESGQFTLLGVSFDQEINLQGVDPLDRSTWPTTWLPVSAVVGTFTGFNANPKGIDIGAIILQDPITSVTLATLPAVGLLDDLKEDHQLKGGPDATRFTVVGYGMLLDWPPPEAFWPDTRMRNTAQSGYHALNDAWLFLNQNLAQGYGGTAQGDSGGPTFLTNPETGQEVLVSITSWGDVPFVATGITYRIDTAESLQFIQDVIDSVEE